MKNKCKSLLEKGFVLLKDKKNKETVYLLVKEDCVIKICEFDTYEISLDGGVTFNKISQSNLISSEDKKEIDYRLWMYEACEYREKEDYEPTEIILEIVSKYF